MSLLLLVDTISSCSLPHDFYQMDAVTSYSLEFSVSVWMKKVSSSKNEPRVIVIIEPVERSSGCFRIDLQVWSLLLSLSPSLSVCVCECFCFLISIKLLFLILSWSSPSTFSHIGKALWVWPVACQHLRLWGRIRLEREDLVWSHPLRHSPSHGQKWSG